jgi:hypothetical protein
MLVVVMVVGVIEKVVGAAVVVVVVVVVVAGADIVKLLVIKPGLSVGSTSVGKGDIAVTSSSSPFPAVVIYGALNKL